MATYPTIESSNLVWYFSGDAEKVQQMVRDLTFIGARRGQGFGEIAQVSCSEVQENPLVDANGLVRRPIPVGLLPLVADAAPQEQQRVVFTPHRHPLTVSTPEFCAVPKSNMVSFANDGAVEVDGETFYE